MVQTPDHGRGSEVAKPAARGAVSQLGRQFPVAQKAARSYHGPVLCRSLEN